MASAHNTTSSSSSSTNLLSSCTTFVSLFLLILFSSPPPAAASTPFILVHGFWDHCGSSQMRHLLGLFTKHSGANGSCVKIGNGLRHSALMPMNQQAAEFCTKVKNMKELKQGFNVVALSQGSLLARSMIQYCDGAPPVKNYISLGGPQAGTASIPGCGVLPYLMRKTINSIIVKGVYSDFCQKRLSASGYIKLPKDIDIYLKKNRFLPKLNNEIPGQRNSTYKERFSSLQNLVLIMFEQDVVIVPRQSSWFGYYADGSLKTILSPNETKLYKEDWIGLRTLDEAGKVKFISMKGQHLSITDKDAKRFVIPYLKDAEAAVTDKEVCYTSLADDHEEL